MESDKIFLRCLDMGAIEVYELDSIYTYPVKGKNWSHLGISIGPGKKYEVLKIGDKDVVDADLQTLIKDLFNSRLIVNREGLGFLTTTGLTATLLGVEYLRLFDLFDWSKYQVKTSMNTRWGCRDFVDGRPMDKELEEEKHKNERELAEEKGKKDKELKDKQEEIENLKKKLAEAELKKEILSWLDRYYIKKVENMQQSLPSSKISISPNDITFKDGRNLTEFRYPFIPIKMVDSLSSVPTQTLKCAKSSYENFDLNNWRVIQAVDSYYYGGNDSEKTAVYYAGEYKNLEIKVYQDRETIPIPCPADQLKYYYPLYVQYIMGIGPRLTFTG